MQVNPYLFYNGNCEAAFRYYEKVLGAKIEALMSWKEGPSGTPIPAGQESKVMHARLTIDGEVLMAGDAPPDHFRPPQGFAVSLTVDSPQDAERRFKALSEGGTVTMPFAATFFSRGFGMCVDQFGMPWMVNCPM